MIKSRFCFRNTRTVRHPGRKLSQPVRASDSDRCGKQNRWSSRSYVAMNLSPRVRRVLVGLGVLAALLAATLVWLPSVVARKVTLHYLERAGVTASIGDIDVNLLSGTLVLENAEGHGPEGDGFSIGRLRVSLEYLPLWSKRVSLSQLSLADTAIDIRRGADNDLRIGGITVARGGSGPTNPPNWGLALQTLTLSGLRIHYAQPAHGQQPAIDRELVFNDSSARGVVTWQEDNDTTLDANMRMGDSHIRVTGQVTPFGQTVSGHFDLQTDDFSLDLLSPITQPGDVQRLTGTIDSDQQIDIRYDPAESLSVTIDGRAVWQGSKMALAKQLAVSGERFKWQGQVALKLLRADGAPATLGSDGHLQVTKLALDGPGALRLSQAAGGWQGKADVTLGAAGMRLAADGTLDSQGLDVRVGDSTRVQTPGLRWNGTTNIEPKKPGQTGMTANGQLAAERLQAHLSDTNQIDARRLNWQGSLQALFGSALRINGDVTLKADDLDMTVAGNTRVNGRGLRWQGKIDGGAKSGVQVDSNGSLKASELKLKVPGSLDMSAAPLTWQGEIGVKTQHTTRIHSDGRLNTGPMTFAVPGSAIFNSSDALWNGTLDFDIGTQLARTASGRLIANDARLHLPNQPVALSSDRVMFRGDYGQQPDTGDGLKLSLNGDLANEQFTLTNTVLDAPWTTLRDVEVRDLTIDGVKRIGFDHLTAQGVRALGDTDTRTAVLDAITTTVRGFRLRDLRRYRVADLDIDGANIHLARDAQGMGLIALYFGGDESEQSTPEKQAAKAPSTYAIEHLSLSAPLLAFNDASVTPAVSLQGANMELKLSDLDTDARESEASYRLSLDVERYGHFDSIGKVAPLATGGMNMDIRAWLRSLSLAPVSGYLNAAMGRRIARGVADGTLDLKAHKGELDGNLDTTLTNFELVDEPNANTDILLGISFDTALDMARRDGNNIRFDTRILGDVTNPYFSIRNLVREAVLAGLRSTVLSDYSPLGLLNNVKKALLDLGRPLASKPVVFPAGRHYIRTGDRGYLSKIAQSMRRDPRLGLVIQGYATAKDAQAMAGFEANLGNSNRSLTTLAKQRATAVRDYLAARDVNPDRLNLAQPVVEDSDSAQAKVTLTPSQAARRKRSDSVPLSGEDARSSRESARDKIDITDDAACADCSLSWQILY